MTDQTEQTTTQPDAVPTRIELDDFIEAVSRGVARALQAEEVSGYLLSSDPFAPGQRSRWPGTVTIGIVYTPPNPGSIFPAPSGTVAR